MAESVRISPDLLPGPQGSFLYGKAFFLQIPAGFPRLPWENQTLLALSTAFHRALGTDAVKNRETLIAFYANYALDCIP